MGVPERVIPEEPGWRVVPAIEIPFEGCVMIWPLRVNTVSVAAGWKGLVMLLMTTAVAVGTSEYVVPEIVKGLSATSLWLPIMNWNALFSAMTWEPMINRWGGNIVDGVSGVNVIVLLPITRM